MKNWIKNRVGEKNVGNICVLKQNWASAVIAVKRPITVFKKVYTDFGGKVIELIIPAGAIISIHNSNNKCRTNIAVLPAFKSRYDEHYSSHNFEFKYKSEGDVLMASSAKMILKNYGQICAPGIHFFFKITQARDY